MLNCSICKHARRCEIYETFTLGLPSWLKNHDNTGKLKMIYQIIADGCPVKENGPCVQCWEHKENRKRYFCKSCEETMGKLIINKNKSDNQDKKDKK